MKLTRCLVLCFVHTTQARLHRCGDSSAVVVPSHLGVGERGCAERCGKEAAPETLLSVTLARAVAVMRGSQRGWHGPRDCAFPSSLPGSFSGFADIPSAAAFIVAVVSAVRDYLYSILGDLCGRELCSWHRPG